MADELLDKLPEAPDETETEAVPLPEAPAPEAGDDSTELRARLRQLELEKLLLIGGVPEEDLDYCLFRIGRREDAGRDPEGAARAVLKQYRARQRAAANTGLSLNARPARTETANEAMNRLIRGREL